MNNFVLFDETYTPYESNKDVTLSSDLTNGAKTITGICVDQNLGTFSDSGASSATTREHTVIVLSSSCSDGSSLQIAEEFKIGSTAVIKVDEDVREKVASYSDLSVDQKNIVETALQLNKDENNRVFVISDSSHLESILTGEGIEVKTYEKSGMLYGYICYRWNI